jgi:hypothetical protein
MANSMLIRTTLLLSSVVAFGFAAIGSAGNYGFILD